MKILRNEKGFALGFVLVLSVIALLMTVGMMMMVSRGSFMSGQQSRFRTAAEAGMGGVMSMFQIMDARGGLIVTLDNEVLNSSIHPKINFATGSINWSGLDNTLVIDPAALNTYDMRLDVGVYRVYMKIADTVEGNSAAGESLLKSGVANSGTGEIVVMSVPYLYTIEVLSQNRVNARERSKISVLYQY